VGIGRKHSNARLLRRVLRELVSSVRPSGDPTDPPPEIQESNRLTEAVDAIRVSNATAWFEPDYRDARRLARACPECRVFAPTGHLRLVRDHDPRDR